MKKVLFTSMLTCLAAFSLRADLFYFDSFDYVNGPIIVVGTNSSGGTNWYRTGAATAADFYVNSHKAEISASGAGASRAEDVHCFFPGPYTNANTVMYASFLVNCTNLPPAVGTYFAHFYANSSGFHGRVFAQAGGLANTWRLGVSAGSGTVNKVFPVDLAANADYQVVLEWDPVTQLAATLWVNPITSADANFTSGDAVTLINPVDAVGFGFRQASSFGTFFCTVTNLAVATTFEEAQTNTLSTNAIAPVVLVQPKPGTNFVGDSFSITNIANGQGLANLTYQWRKDGANIANPNGNTNILSLVNVALTDRGNYDVVVSTPFGLSVTSVSAFRWVTNAPIPPSISPTGSTAVAVFYHQSTTLSVSASGPPPITYAWYYTNAPATGGNVSDDGLGNLTITDVFTNNGTTGAYYAVASNPYGSKTSGVFTVSAVGPPAVSIAYLRTLVDPVTYIATNSSQRWQATGTVTTFTNLTTGDTSSYYLQDSTAGINIFVTHGGTFRPTQGDVLTFVGWLSSFNSTLELEADASDPTTSFTVLSNNVAGLPAPKVIPFGVTNNLPLCEYNLEGSIVMLTNVFFGTNEGRTISTNANTTVTVTNSAGETFTVFFSSVDLDTAGQALPGFAWTVAGPLTQDLGNAVNPRNQNYRVTVSRFSDIITNAPVPVTSAISYAGNSATVTWTAVPYSYSYSVLAATSVNGPYVPVATGLTFTGTLGTYTDTSAGGTFKSYRVVSP